MGCGFGYTSANSWTEHGRRRNFKKRKTDLAGLAGGTTAHYTPCNQIDHLLCNRKVPTSIQSETRPATQIGVTNTCNPPPQPPPTPFPAALLADDDVGLNVLGCRADILGANCKPPSSRYTSSPSLISHLASVDVKQHMFVVVAAFLPHHPLFKHPTPPDLSVCWVV